MSQGDESEKVRKFFEGEANLAALTAGLDPASAMAKAVMEGLVAGRSHDEIQAQIDGTAAAVAELEAKAVQTSAIRAEAMRGLTSGAEALFKREIEEDRFREEVRARLAAIERTLEDLAARLDK